MRKLNHALLAGALALACASCTTEKEANYQVIPLPQEVSLTQGNPFKLNENVLIAYPENNALLQRNAEFLSEYIQQATNYAPKTKAIAAGEQVKNAIVLGLDPGIANKEGYVLTTTPEGISINGQTENGVFYGIQTLRKSIPAEAKGATILIPAGEIKDEPRFSYRGMHLDVGRHFFPKEFIKKYIDLLALHNMNTFHWHLTEDQGWRIEIKKYPKLTEIGSQRSRTVIGKNTQEYDNTPYGGFYTQEEAKEIVKYAQERYITVIPEVDLPGHMLAALAAYPELGCTGGPYEVCPRWGVFEDVLCIGNDKTMQFLEDVMSEIIEIFPSEYVHIGGDEAASGGGSVQRGEIVGWTQSGTGVNNNWYVTGTDNKPSGDNAVNSSNQGFDNANNQWPVYSTDPSNGWGSAHWKSYSQGEYPKLLWEE